MLSEIKIHNFKCFKNETTIPIGKLTLLTGVNGKGKSTVVQSLLLTAQSLIENENSNVLILNGGMVNLGTFDDIRSTDSSPKLAVSFQYYFENSENNSHIYWNSKFNRRYLNEEDGAVEDEGVLKLISSSLISPLFEEKNIKTLNYLQNIEGIYHAQLKNLIGDFSRLIFISADRLGPQTFHNSHLNSNIIVGKNGENTALTIHKYREYEVTKSLRLKTGKTNMFPEQISAWIAFIFNSGSIKVDSISESLKKMAISPDGTINDYKPENVGYGFSYCLPIIVAGLVAKKGDILIVENPEAHLHPSAQNRITKFLCSVAASGVTTIIETHSPSILNGVRLSVKNSILKGEDTSVLFFGENEKQIERVLIQDEGNVNHWPKGFFDQDEIDLDNLHGL